VVVLLPSFEVCVRQLLHQRRQVSVVFSSDSLYLTISFNLVQAK
jgi:hypothetical protein